MQHTVSDDNENRSGSRATLPNAGSRRKRLAGNAHELDEVFIVTIQILQSFNHKGGDPNMLQSAKNELPRNRGEGGGEVKENRSRVGVVGHGMFDSCFLSV